MAEKKEPTPDLVSVKVITDNHEHKGIAIPVGTIIDVTHDEAAFLLKHNVIEG